jgi:translation initiation factor 1 (eIF-1/SUI1)
MQNPNRKILQVNKTGNVRIKATMRRVRQTIAAVEKMQVLDILRVSL